MTNSRVSKKKHTNSNVDDEVEILKRYLKISVMSSSNGISEYASWYRRRDDGTVHFRRKVDDGGGGRRRRSGMIIDIDGGEQCGFLYLGEASQICELFIYLHSRNSPATRQELSTRYYRLLPDSC